MRRKKFYTSTTFFAQNGQSVIPYKSILFYQVDTETNQVNIYFTGGSPTFSVTYEAEQFLLFHENYTEWLVHQ